VGKRNILAAAQRVIDTISENEFISGFGETDNETSCARHIFHFIYDRENDWVQGKASSAILVLADGASLQSRISR